MRKYVFFFLFLSTVCNPWLFAQRKGFEYHFSGFVDPQLFMDSRQVVGGRESQMLLYPAPRKLDSKGNDENAVPNLNMLAITTRLGMEINAPEKVGRYAVSGYVEGDFTGSTEAGINMLRLRHAYVQFCRGEFREERLLLGQYWHPLVVPEIMPGTRPLNMGLPFHPYSRYVQARYERGGRHIRWATTAAFQLDNSSLGPEGRSTEYLRQTGLPEGNAEISLLWGHGGKIENMVGLMANAELLRPRKAVTLPSGERLRTGATFPSYAFSLFGAHYFNGKWKLSYQGIYGDNLYEQSLIGGYIATEKVPGEYRYTPWGCYTLWADFRRLTGKWRPGLFAAYGRNKDFGRNVTENETVYGRGWDIDYLWRVQPQLAFCPKTWLQFFAEAEYTSVRYGEEKPIEAGKHMSSAYAVGNLRLILAAVYSF
ncbi:MAG: hypothetical protein J5873_01960 [Bacteroidales bacterium]|nr:hypothetical protein [Bacteroidales bacterium]